MTLSIGDKAPPVLGATVSGRFYSLDAQAGRPVLLVALGACEAEAGRRLFDRIQAARAALGEAVIDLAPLAPMSSVLGVLYGQDPQVTDQLVFMADGSDLACLVIDDAPGAMILDRSGRIVDLFGVTDETDLAAIARQTARILASEPSRHIPACAPALLVPNILSRELCQAVIAHFETSPHTEGYMAGIKDGVAYSKLDESKKKRRDMELTPDCPLHAEIVKVLAYRCAPEIKRAFQADITFADRILIARYDDTGGYFKRHRDDTAPQTKFREFAVSINLNTEDYQGGELLFPEYDDHRYSPPAGSAIIFSASLLHEAAAVTKGSRYVLLSFLCTAKAEALHPQNAAAA